MRTERGVRSRIPRETGVVGLLTLVSKVRSELLVEVDWEVFDPDDLQTSDHRLDSTKGVTRRRTKGVNGVRNPTFAIIVITMCSLRLNLPGLRLHV